MNLPPDPGPSPAQPDRPIDRRLLDEIFGDVLPETTSDEREAGRSGGAQSDDWYRENRPPHHGG